MLESRKNTELHICTALFNSQAVIFQEYFLNLWRFDKRQHFTMGIFNRNESCNKDKRAAIKHNPFREELSIEDYARYTSVYATILESYVDFFERNWHKDDVEKTNEDMIKDLERFGITRWSGLSADENNPLGEYVLALDCPVTTTQMKDFFKRVLMGDLEFRCRYPIGDTDALTLIRTKIGQL